MEEQLRDYADTPPIGFTQGAAADIIMTLPGPAELIANGEMAFFQNGAKILSKTIDQCEVDANNNLHCKLTAAETRKFSPQRFTISFRCLGTDGTFLQSAAADFAITRNKFEEAPAWEET